MPRENGKPQNRGKDETKFLQSGLNPKKAINPGYVNPNKRKLEDDSITTESSKKPQRSCTGDAGTVQTIGSTHVVPAKASLTCLPPETIQEIFKYTNHISGACLALTCKYLYKNAKKLEVSCPPVQAKYSYDCDRLRFMKLLMDWMPEDYRLCWMCRKYKPIHGSSLVLYEQRGVSIKKKTIKPPMGSKYEKFKKEREDDDWTFVSLGACKSKQKKIDTRTYCPKCTRSCLVLACM